MIRTVYFRCTLPRRVADALNRESGWIYTRVLVEHYRIYRKQGIWLKRGQAEKLDDAYHAGAGRLLHAHSIDAAQQGFYAACQTARTNKGNGRDGTKYPHKRKGHRTTVWKQTGLRLKDRRTSAERKASRGQPLIADSQSVLLLALAQGQAPLEVPLPSHLAGLGEAAFREMRLVYNKATRRYEWHLVIEDGQVAEPVDGKHVVAGDLGEIHPITLADDAQAQVIACRELRATRQYTNKTLAEIAHLQSQCTRHSRRWWRLERRKRRFLEKQARRVRDMEHKASRAAVDFAQERGAAVIAIGDVRDIADGKRLNSHSQQKISQWSHGTLRNFITYKANTVGITVVSTVSEVDTTKTCPNPACNHRHKPTGRIYRCPACGLVAHRDVVGAVNIRSRFLHGAVGCLSPPPNTTYRHPYYQRTPHRRGKRSPQVTGHVAGKRTPHRNRGSSPYPTPRQNRRNSHQDKRAATGLR